VENALVALANTGERRTRLAEEVSVKLFRGWSVGRDLEYHARRTDVASGNTRIYFTVDPAVFDDEAQAIDLKVTYRDRGDSAFELEYESADGKATSGAIPVGDSGAWRTITLHIPEMMTTGQRRGDTDFALHVTGDADVAFKFVRLVKATPPK